MGDSLRQGRRLTDRRQQGFDPPQHDHQGRRGEGGQKEAGAEDGRDRAELLSALGMGHEYADAGDKAVQHHGQGGKDRDREAPRRQGIPSQSAQQDRVREPHADIGQQPAGQRQGEGQGRPDLLREGGRGGGGHGIHDPSLMMQCGSKQVEFSRVRCLRPAGRAL
jgi:hypothetical protein